MIGYLQGTVLEISEEGLVVLSQGVGYEVLCPRQVLDFLDVGVSADLWVYTHVREDALQLFGFRSKKDKALFLSLIKVSGIGPKSAIHILSATTFENLSLMIENGDVKGLSQLPKVGKKTAEQLILSLKGQLIMEKEPQPGKKERDVRDQVTSALVNLGFKLSEVQKVVETIKSDTPVELAIRQSLSSLTQ